MIVSQQITVLTAIYDGYEELAPAPLERDIDFVCVTDRWHVGDSGRGWEIRVEPSDLHPNRAAKRPKMLPWLYTESEYVLWIDGSFTVDKGAVKEMLKAVDWLAANPIAQFPHPHRDCIYDEGEHTLEYAAAKYECDLIEEQLCRYESEGHPEHWGLWATGVILRRWTPAVERMGYLWYADNLRYSYQDQLSEAPALRYEDLRPLDLPGQFWENPWMTHRPSSRH